MNVSESVFTLPEQRSLELLESIVEANHWADYIGKENDVIRIRIQGQSKRWYSVTAKRDEHKKYTSVSHARNPWVLNVKGGARKRDLLHNNRYCPNLCLNLRQSSHLPIGDKIAALCLSLHNDLATAMNIPLLAQFIVCPRDFLRKVMVFQDEMVVLYSMLDGDDIPDEFMHMAQHENEYEEEAFEEWDDDFLDIEPSESAPSPPQPQEVNTIIEANPPFIDRYQMSEEELAEQRMWEAYEQHMEDMARDADWDNSVE